MNDRSLKFQNKFTKTKVPKSNSGLDELYKIVKINQNKEKKPEEKKNTLFESKILYKEKVSLVPIDSIYRNQDIYPEPNHFVISLRKKFQNIKSLELVASVFPNTDNAIINTGNRQNNKVYWQNKEDLQSFFLKNISAVYISSGLFVLTIPNYNVLSNKITVYMWSTNSLVNGKRILYNNFDGTFNFYNSDYNATFNVNLNLPAPVYTCNITEGNYNINTICTEIQTQMKKVLRGDNTTFHYFYITPNLDTDLITFESLITTELDLNPISTVKSNYIISVKTLNLDIITGNLFRILNSTSVGGISSIVLNDEFKITPIRGGFKYTVTTKASTTSTGGGNSVVIGKPDSFKFLFSKLNRFNLPTYLGSLQRPLGFFGEESNEFLNSTNSKPLSTVSFPIVDITPGNTTTIHITGTLNNVIIPVTNLVVTNITNNIITVSTPHLLTFESQIQLFCLNCILSNGSKTNLTQLVQVLSISQYTLKIINSSKIISVISLSGTSLIKYGDRIRLQGISLNSNVKNYLGNNQFYVESISGSTFVINYHTSGFTFIIENSITNISGISLNTPNPYVTTSLIKVNHPNHTFNEITQILCFNTANTISIICKFNHSLTNFQLNFINLVPFTNPDYILVTTYIYNTILNVGDFIDIYIRGLTFGDPLQGKYTAEVISFSNHSGLLYNISFIIYFPGFTFPHGSDGSFYEYSIYKPLVISGTNTVLNDLNGIYYIYSSDTHSSNISNIFSPNAITNENINFPNGKGFINTKNNDIRLFRVSSNIGASTVADVPLSVINNYNRSIRLIDINNYYISVDNFFFFGGSVQFGGNSVTISSDLHGFGNTLCNTKDWTVNTTVARKVALEGDNYVFLSIPQPKMDSVVVNPSSDVSDVFAQILLSESPGNIIFNSFVSVPYLFDPLLPTIDSFEIKVLYTDSNLYDFKDTDFSITLKVTEVIIKLETEEEKEEQNIKKISDRLN